MSNRSGYVLIMKWNETLSDYEQLGEPMFSDNNGDGFGYTLALSGDANAGEVVRAYRWDKTDSSLKLNGTLCRAQDDRFGYSPSPSISPDNRVIAVWAIGSPSAQQHQRILKVYAWDADSLVYKQQGSPINGDTPNDKFGWSCSLSSGGKYLAVGALLDVSGGSSFDDSTITTAGQVKAYMWEGTQYKQVGDALYGDRNKDNFGASIFISVDGKILVVGAPQNDSNGAQSGQVKLFKLNDSGSNYTLFGELLLGERSSNYFGGPIAIAGDSKSFAVGAVGNGKEGDFSGQLQIFLIPSS